MIQIIIENQWSTIENLPHNSFNRLNDLLSYDIPGANFVISKAENARTKEERIKYARYLNWDGKKRLIKKSRNKENSAIFLSGLLNRVCMFFIEEYKIMPKIIDNRKKVLKSRNFIWNEKHPLYDYQEDVVRECINRTKGLIEICTGGGKCCDKDTLIPTEEGLLPIEYFSKVKEKEHEEYKIKIQSEFGEQETLNFYNDGISESIEIETNEGYRVSGTVNHKIKVLCEDGEVRFLKLKDINKNHIPIIYRGPSIFGKGDISEEEAYFLGILFGDGYMNKKDHLSLTTGDNHIAKFYKNFLNENGFLFKEYYNSENSININSRKDSRDYIEKRFSAGYSLSINKKIPISILKSKKESLAAFIKGLFETDGWTEKNGRVCIGLSNEILIRQIQTILLQYGIISWIRRKKTKKHDSFILSISERKSLLRFLENKMLSEDGYKIKRLKELINSKKVINTNIDLLYNNKTNIKKIIYENLNKVSIKNKTKFIKDIDIEKNTLYSYIRKINNRNPSINMANKIFQYSDFDIKKYLDGNFFFSKIKSISTKQGQNYDFEIPSTRSFIGNGFVNHNTRVASKIAQELSVDKFIFYVLTKDLMYQAKEELEKYIKNVKVGLVGDGHCDIKEITVMTIQTAYKCYEKTKKNYEKESFVDIDEGDLEAIRSENLDHLKRKESIKNLIESCEAIYFDEAHHASADTCQKIIGYSKNCYYIYGGTATPERADNATMMIEGLFGRKVGEITASFLIEKGLLIKPEIYYINLKTKKQKVKTYAEDYKLHITENEERNKYIIEIAKYMESKKIPTIILVQRIAHGEYLLKNLPLAKFIHGKSSNRQEVIDMMRDGRLNTLIASTLADEGLDIRRLSCLVMAGGGKSAVKCKQRVGRVLRLCPEENKNISYVYDFNDIGRWLPEHSFSRKKILKQEKSFIIKETDKLEFNKKKDLF